jgi:hypothetical protein
VPMPLALRPKGDTYETSENRRFRFHVEISLPLVGLIVRYRGTLQERDVGLAALGGGRTLPQHLNRSMNLWLYAWHHKPTGTIVRLLLLAGFTKALDTDKLTKH